MTGTRLGAVASGALLAGLLLAAPALAQEPPTGPEEGTESVEEISRRISRSLKENEDLLARLSRGEETVPPAKEGDAKPDPAAAKEKEEAEGAAVKGERAAVDIGRLIRQTGGLGRTIAEDIQRLLEAGT